MSERSEELMMKAVDGLLEPAEREELEALLAADPARRAELEDFLQIKEATDAMTQRIAAHARIEPVRETPATQTANWAGLLLVFTGAALLTGYGAYELFVDPDVPTLVKVGSGLLGAGLLGLFGRALWVRLRGLKHDPYTEIDR